jgi:hypothetical protein
MGHMNLFRTTVEGDQLIWIYQGRLENVVYDERHNVASFAIWMDDYQDLRQGIYIISLYGGTPQLVMEGLWEIAWWKEMEIFVAFQREGGIAGFDAEGAIIFRNPDAIGGKYILPAPNQPWMAVASSDGAGLLDQEGQILNQIINGEVDGLFWGPDGLILFVIVDEEQAEILYAYDPKTNQLSFVDSDVPSDDWRYSWFGLN